LSFFKRVGNIIYEKHVREGVLKRSVIAWLIVLAFILSLRWVICAEAQEAPTKWNTIEELGVRYHIVVRGDTLWDISEHYFGNPFDWPKLWQWNTQILNPHWIYPGNKIRLTPFPVLKAEEEKAAPPPPPPPPPPTPVVEAPPPPEKYYFATGNYGSFISPKPIQPAGYIQRGIHKKPFMGDKEGVYLTQETGTGLHAGSRVCAYEQSEPIHHPVSRKFMGYIITFLGQIAIRDFRDGFYEGEIEEAYKEIPPKTPVADYNIPSAKIKIIEKSPFVEGTIIATAKKKTELSKNDLVFLDRGSANGLEQGHILSIILIGDTIQKFPTSSRAQLPSRNIGKLIIVGSMEKTSTAVILESVEPVHVGYGFASQVE